MMRFYLDVPQLLRDSWHALGERIDAVGLMNGRAADEDVCQ